MQRGKEYNTISQHYLFLMKLAAHDDTNDNNNNNNCYNNNNHNNNNKVLLSSLYCFNFISFIYADNYHHNKKITKQ